MISQIKNLLKKGDAKPKVSEMLINVAGNFISMGDDEEEKQQLLNCAVSAWNMACLEEEKKGNKKIHHEIQKTKSFFFEKRF